MAAKQVENDSGWISLDFRFNSKVRLKPLKFN